MYTLYVVSYIMYMALLKWIYFTYMQIKQKQLSWQKVFELSQFSRNGHVFLLCCCFVRLVKIQLMLILFQVMTKMIFTEKVNGSSCCYSKMQHHTAMQLVLYYLYRFTMARRFRFWPTATHRVSDKFNCTTSIPCEIQRRTGQKTITASASPDIFVKVFRSVALQNPLVVGRNHISGYTESTVD